MVKGKNDYLWAKGKKVKQIKDSCSPHVGNYPLHGHHMLVIYPLHGMRVNKIKI